MSSTHDDPAYESAIAIIGMTGRFPGSNDIDQFWNNLVAGERLIQPLSDAQLRLAGVDEMLLHHPDYVKAGTTVEGVDMFDATFFGFTPREAEVMDPQHRIFLECAWEALERAGYTAETYRGLIGIFAGSASSSYRMNNLFSNRDMLALVGDLQISVGNDPDSLASTVSHRLNLRGPSVAVQTFCSTSLVAVHLACQSLLTYECSIALAGGVAITVPQQKGYLYQEGGITSPDGHCRTFDAQANGSVMGSGAGVVALKRFADAVAAGDQIYAVIRGSAINNDGLHKVGYTAPGVAGQAAVICRALGRAELAPDQISYIEAHGTATALGDSVELAAMIKAFRAGTDKRQFCAIGSLKPNIGHLDRASGVTGLIKTALSLVHEQIPPQLDFAHADQELELDSSPFYINTACADWKRGLTPRRAGVSSFGLGGTNAHVVLEEAPAPRQAGASRPYQVLPLSAKTSAALDATAVRLAAQLAAQPQLDLADAAYTLQVGRAAFNHRRAMVVSDTADALSLLQTVDTRRVFTADQAYKDRAVAFMFPDAHLHYQHMAADLYATEPVFRAQIVACADLFVACGGGDLIATHFAGAAHGAAATSAFAVFATEYALAHLLQQWGVRPGAVIGDGIGGYVAACVAGALSLADAVWLVVQHVQAHGKPLSDVALAHFAQRARLSVPTIPCIVGGRGGWLTEAEATDPTYWVALLDTPARIAEAIAVAWAEPSSVLVEVGPGRSMSTKAAQHALRVGIADEVILAALRDAEAAIADQAHVLSLIAQLWVAGVTIDWAVFASGEQRRRVLLPTYPFERHRHWVEPRSGAPTLVEPAALKSPDVADWYYLPVWKQALALPSATPEKLAQKSLWLVFTDQSSLAGHLVAQLAASGSTVITVELGQQFAQFGPTSYSIDPAAFGDYAHLLSAIGRAPKTIVHMWSLATPTTDDLRTRFDQAQTHGFYSLLLLAKAIGYQTVTSEIELWALSGDIYHVTGGEALAPHSAPLLGACRVIPQENLAIICRHLDISVPASGTRQEQQLVRGLLAEFTADAKDIVVAYRSAGRWIQNYEPLALPEPTSATLPLRQRGSYMITGGLGGIGRVLAAQLARAYQARLALVSRTGLPERTKWPDWLATHAATDAASQRICAVQELEALGAEVLVISADVADDAQMRAALAQIDRQFGALHGVIHAAGISEGPGFGVIQDIDRAGCDQHFLPKAHGLYTLDALLEQRDLDFCVLFSSLAAILGGLGFVGYTAANCFIDSYVYEHNQRSVTHWTSVNWDTWRIKENADGVLGATVAMYAMTPEEGIAAFERVLALGGAASQLINSTGDIQIRIDQWVRLLSLRSQDGDTAFTLHPRPELTTAYVATTNETEERIAQIWQNVLGIDKIGIYDNFLDLGGNSLIGTQVVSRLRQAFQLNIPLTILFEAPTVAELALAIELLIIEEIEGLHADDDGLPADDTTPAYTAETRRLDAAVELVEPLELVEATV